MFLLEFRADVVAIRVLSELLDTVREILWRLQALVINSVVVSSDSHSSRKTIWADMAQTTGPKWATPPLRLDSWRRPVRPDTTATVSHLSERVSPGMDGMDQVTPPCVVGAE